MADILLHTDTPEYDIVDRKVRLGILNEPIQRQITSPSRDYAIGDMEEFTWYDYVNGKQSNIQATLEHITEHAYFWFEQGNPVDKAALAKAAERFENEIYPTVRDYFGEEWSPGVDNDPHISILHINDLGMGGAFGNLDEHTREVMPTSNQKEIIYIDLKSVTIGDDNHLSTLAHEFQHMVQWNTTGDEMHWLDEGLAQLSEQINGFDVIFTDHAFMKNSSTQLNSWVEGLGKDTHHYGAAYLFSLYLWERLGDDFIRALARHPAEGMASIELTLDESGYSYSVDDLFSDWTIANYLDNATILDGRYGYTHELLNPICPRQRYFALPISDSRAIPQYSAEYIEIEGKGKIKIEFKGDSEAKLIPTQSHSGESFWWSNRGDYIESNMTREFDLSGVQDATLQYWTWYDIQKDTEEFACISVSTNGGKTWEFPNTQQAASGSYYPCYSGISGNGSEPEWVMDEVVLSPYAGQKVLIRFDYLTETWYNEPGFAVDEIAIPQLEYSYDAEMGEDGWKGEGFVRTSNCVPQNWTARLIHLGEEVKVDVLDIHDGVASGEVVLGEGIDKAVIVIGAMAPKTNEEAHYELQITGELTGMPTAKTMEAGISYADDYSDVCSGWDAYDDLHKSFGYINGAYFLEVKGPQSGAMVTSKQDFNNIKIEVETQQEVALQDNSWGVLCNYQDENNYYSFNISNNGLFSIDAIVNGNYVPLAGWTTSSAINTGAGANNQLAVNCKSGLLSFTVNGLKLAELKDDTFTHGDVGYIANTYSQGGARILYDNLVIRSP
jgi:hypothetical protein